MSTHFPSKGRRRHDNTVSHLRGGRLSRGTAASSPEALPPLPPNPSSTLLPPVPKSAPSHRHASDKSPSNLGVLNDSLTCQTMQALLHPVPARSPKWRIHQASEARKKEIQQLQRWTKGELDRVRKDCAASPRKLEKNKTIEQIILRLVDCIAGGTGVGDDITAQVLLDVWNATSTLTDHRWNELHQELVKTKQKAKQSEELVAKLQLQLSALQDAAWASGQRPTYGGSRENAPYDDNRLKPGGHISDSNKSLPSGESPDAGAVEKSSDESFASMKAALKVANAELQVENGRLKQALDAAKRDLNGVRQRIAALEVLAGKSAEAESRALVAEEALAEAMEKMGCMTPRPAPDYLALRNVLSENLHKLKDTLEAIHRHEDASAETLAAVLLGESPSTSSAPNNVQASFSIGVEKGPPQATAHEPSQATAEDSKSIIASEHSNTSLGPYFGLLKSSISHAALEEALSCSRGSTAVRYAVLESMAGKLQIECTSMKTELDAFRDAERRREAAKRRREEEDQLEKKNAVQQYLEMLSQQGEAAWKEQLIGMGQGLEVPKVFRHTGKVRNKHLPKRDTEKLVKELWKERLMDPAVAAGRAGELVDFLGSFLQKKVGIAAAVIDLAYNFLYGLWLYQWDADCELFLKILAGEIREEVYIAQNRLQTDMEDLFAALDKAKGQATGTIPKEDVRTALHSFFRVGESGGKTAVRFDEAMQAMDADQPGGVIEWKKVFEEDREFNQGEFAESLRDQFLQERLEFFSALETALYEQVGDGDECTAEQVIQAILATDQDCEQKLADSTVKATFGPGVNSMAVKVVMKKLSRGILRGNVLSRDSVAGQGQGRQSQSSNGSARGSIASKGRGSMNSGKDSGSKVGLLATPKKQNPAVSRALEAVRKEWIHKQTEHRKDGASAPATGEKETLVGHSPPI